MSNCNPTGTPGPVALGFALSLSFVPGAVLAQGTPDDPLAAAERRGSPTCLPFPGADAFVAEIDHPYLPSTPGTVFTYLGSDGERTVVEVTDQTRTVDGVETRVVRDTVTDPSGQLIEDTRDWFAQDEAGNVWYFGEEVKNYEDGVLADAGGSWEAGVDGAEPGILMPARPEPGQRYAQECAPGEAEDKAEVLRLGDAITVPFGSFDDVLVTREWTPLEPGVAEQKFYARCLGFAREVTVEGGEDEAVLVDVTPKPQPQRASGETCGGGVGATGAAPPR